jgi:hypothetical protein
MNNISSAPQSSHNIFTQGIQKYQYNKYREIEKYYLSETIKLSLLTGPLYCISANMQFMSKTFLNGITVDNKFSFKMKNLPQISLIFPFKPYFHSNYKECLFNLRRQGTLAFYKGNMYRLLFFSGTNQLKKTLDPLFSQYIKISRRLKEVLLYSFVDILLNPLLFIESRYSIQSRRPGFRIYNSLFDVIKKSGREIYLGASYSIPRNIIFLLSLNVYFMYPSQYLQILSVFIAHLLSYPILTLQRNKIYHSTSTEYFPRPDPNFSFGKDFVKTFGFLSLYRGFSAYILATLLWHFYVPKMAKAKFYNNALKDDKEVMKMDFFEDDEYEDEDEVQSLEMGHKP